MVTIFIFDGVTLQTSNTHGKFNCVRRTQAKFLPFATLNWLSCARLYAGKSGHQYGHPA